jgi:hypothetical protein
LRLNVTHLSMLWGEDDLVLKGELSQRVALKADRSRKGIS